MILLKDLECYKAASERLRDACNGNLAFETDIIRSGLLRDEFEAFILYKFSRLSLPTVRSMVYPTNVLIRFVGSQREKKSFVLYGRSDTERKYKAYLYENGYPITRQRKRKYRSESVSIVKSEYVAIFDDFYDWLEEINDNRTEKDKDVWDVRKLGVNVRQNPVNPRYRLDYRQIPMCFRDEVKNAIYLQATIRSMQTLQGEVRAANEFFGFIGSYYPEISDCSEINRERYEEYLIWRKTQSGASSEVIKREISDLKTLFSFISMLYGKKNLTELSFMQDRVRVKDKLPAVYSKAEMRRFNEALGDLEKQMVRALFIHEMVGTRISDTLTLRMDCLSEDGAYIFIKQNKTHKAYKRHISGKTKALIEKSIEYTRTLGIDTEYVFSNEDGTPWTYSKINYHMTAMIAEKDLRMDDGSKFVFLSHQFRRSLATDMTEKGFTDRYIAHELGHSNTQTVSKYRRVRNAEIKRQTAKLRDYFNNIYQSNLKEEEHEEE